MMEQPYVELQSLWMLLGKHSRNALEPDIQASKMTDVFPIENVWGIIKARLDEKEINNLRSLKRNIKLVWAEINNDKELCKRLICSMSKRLAVVIRKNGSQINKSDY